MQGESMDQPCPGPDIMEAESNLLEHISMGDTRAFWQLWGNHSEKLFNRCLFWMNGNRTEAEDAMAEAMMKALRNIKDFKGTSAQVEAWLSRIIYNHCLDLFRRRKTRGDLPYDQIQFDNLINHMQTPDLNLENKDILFDALTLALDLPEKLKGTFLLYLLDSCSYEDIASQLDISRNNVRKRIQLARDWIKTNLTAINEGRQARPLLSAAQLKEQLDLARNETKRIDIHKQIDVTRVELGDGVMLSYHHFDKKTHPKTHTIQSLDTYLKRYPNGWKKRLELAGLYEQDGQWSKAIQAYQAVLLRKADHFNCAWKAADLLEAMGRIHQASQILMTTAERVARKSQQNILRARSDLLNGNTHDAEKGFQIALQQRPDDPFFSYHLALFWFRVGKYKQAGRFVQSVLEKHPHHQPSRCLLIESLRCGHQREELQEKLCELLKGNPTHLLGLKYWLEEQETNQENVSFCTLLNLSKRVPFSSFYLEPLCLFYQRQGKLEQALCLLQKFVAAYPNGPGGWYRLAYWHYRSGNRHDAEHALGRANALNRDVLDHHCALPTEPKALEKALKISPLLPSHICFF